MLTGHAVAGLAALRETRQPSNLSFSCQAPGTWWIPRVLKGSRETCSPDHLKTWVSVGTCLMAFCAVAHAWRTQSLPPHAICLFVSKMPYSCWQAGLCELVKASQCQRTLRYRQALASDVLSRPPTHLLLHGQAVTLHMNRHPVLAACC